MKNIQNTMNEILEDVKNSYNNSDRLQFMNCGCICVFGSLLFCIANQEEMLTKHVYLPVSSQHRNQGEASIKASTLGAKPSPKGGVPSLMLFGLTGRQHGKAISVHFDAEIIIIFSQSMLLHAALLILPGETQIVSLMYSSVWH